MTFRMPAYVGNAEQRTIPTMSGMAQPRGCMPSASGYRTHTVRAMPRTHEPSISTCTPRAHSIFSNWYTPLPSFFPTFFSPPRVYTSSVILHGNEWDDCNCVTFTFAILAIAAITAFFARLLIIRY